MEARLVYRKLSTRGASVSRADWQRTGGMNKGAVGRARGGGRRMMF